jgi:hypothetical protein
LFNTSLYLEICFWASEAWCPSQSQFQSTQAHTNTQTHKHTHTQAKTFNNTMNTQKVGPVFRPVAAPTRGLFWKMRPRAHSDCRAHSDSQQHRPQPGGYFEEYHPRAHRDRRAHSDSQQHKPQPGGWFEQVPQASTQRPPSPQQQQTTHAPTRGLV